jgi:hypothetical protein
VIRIWLFFVLVVAALCGVAWATDFVTPQGERTVYTAECERGIWQGAHCTGTLVAGVRHRFRALKAHKEVIFWSVGVATEPSGKFTQCTIHDGRNWVCPAANADAARAVAREMVVGRPVPLRPFHSISKWQWQLLRAGVWVGDDAEPA